MSYISLEPLYGRSSFLSGSVHRVMPGQRSASGGRTDHHDGGHVAFEERLLREELVLLPVVLDGDEEALEMLRDELEVLRSSSMITRSSFRWPTRPCRC
jgi:hypothetical protein